MIPAVIEDINRYATDHRAAMIEFVEQLALAESPSNVPEAQEQVLAQMEEALTDLDFHTIRVVGRNTGGYIYARPRVRTPDQPIQLLVGHCDTVWPLQTLPTMPVISNDQTIKGPGVYDMKGGLTQLIFALKALKALSLKPSVAPVILINSDEEIGSKESTAAISRLARLADRAYILEPSLDMDGKLKTGRKGVGRFYVEVQGQPAHAGLDPGKGANAIVELSYLIQELFKMNDPEREISVNVGMVEGGIRPNVVAPFSSAVVDVRVPTQKDAQEVSSRIHALKSENPLVEVRVKGNIGRQPMEGTPANRRLWKKAKDTGESLGIPLKEAFAGGASDGNTTSLYTATLDGLGATGDGAHASHEFLYIDRMVERTTLLVSLLMLEPVRI